MKTLGVLTTAVVSAAALIAVGAAVKSIPDIRRYLKIRSM
ncbi:MULTISPECIES: DUF6893 family small protein [Streptomyces]